jgi:DNA polymerase/3'-5' exonuclease PolX
VYPVEEFAYALLYFTGSDHFNRSMRHYAKARGYSLSDHGIVPTLKVGQQNVLRGTANLAPHARTEQDIFAYLGLNYHEPTDRNCNVTPVARPALRE